MMRFRWSKKKEERIDIDEIVRLARLKKLYGGGDQWSEDEDEEIPEEEDLVITEELLQREVEQLREIFGYNSFEELEADIRRKKEEDEAAKKSGGWMKRFWSRCEEKLVRLVKIRRGSKRNK